MKKISVLLPVLAFVIAIAGAYASSMQVKLYEPNQFKYNGISCLPCEPDEEDPCVTMVLDRRCKCKIGIQSKIGYNAACEALWLLE